MEVTRSAQAEVLLRRLSSAVEEGVASKAMQRVPHLVLLAPAFYKERLRPLLARWLLLLLLQLGLKDLTPAEVRDLVITPKNLTPASCVTVQGRRAGDHASDSGPTPDRSCDSVLTQCTFSPGDALLDELPRLRSRWSRCNRYCFLPVDAAAGGPYRRNGAHSARQRV